MDNIKSVIGLDISRGKLHACILNELPDDLLEFARSYKPIILEATQEGINKLIELGDIFALEPTGADHRIWSENLKAAGKLVVGVTGIRIRTHAKNHGILNKSDREDAAVIAAYTLTHLRKANIRAFVSIESCEIREKFLALQAIKRQRIDLINQTRARLVYEAPEISDATATPRQWCNNSPPAIWRAIAGEPTHTNAVKVPDKSIGRGISPLTQAMAQQLCTLERLECALEIETQTLLDRPEFNAYQTVFKTWHIHENTAVAILSAIYPLDQFLDENSQPIRKKVWATDKSKHSKTSRDRSLKQFKRASGAGQMRIQSGNKETWVSTGDAQVRAACYMFLEKRVLTARMPRTERIIKLFPEVKDKIEGLSLRKKKKLLESYTLKALAQKWMNENQTFEEPWKNERLIQEACTFTGTSPRLAQLMLFYDLAPQCQNQPKKKRLMKIFPRFITLLFKDLTKSVQNMEYHTEQV